MRTALIIGLGVSGRSAAQYLLHAGWRVLAVDKKRPAASSLEIEFLKEDPENFPSHCDLVILSPGISRDHPFYLLALEKGIEIIDEAELALRALKNPIIGITGTNGKTTVTSLVAHILNASGLKAHALGNIGDPLASYAIAPDPSVIVVAELSSYQLEFLKTRALDAAVILNITPDHLDRYSSFREYAKAKIAIAGILKPSGELFIHESILKEWPDLMDKIPHTCFGYLPETALRTDKKKAVWREERLYELPDSYGNMGIHDCENVLAAFALVKRFGISCAQFLKALETFRKPPHRIEFIAEIQGVRYYDDSKGTNVDATIHAVHAVPGDVLLIAGGVDKGSSYFPWAEKCKNKIVHIYAIGQAAEKICRELDGHFSVEIAESLDGAVSAASSKARAGQTVLLSPGCSSFDMFRDYAHRGEAFQGLVHGLSRTKE